MIFAQFFRTDLNGNLSEACGDRSVIIVDGRLSLNSKRELAARECKARGFEAWQLFTGDSFNRGIRAMTARHRITN